MKSLHLLRLLAACATLIAGGAVYAQEKKFDEPPVPTKTVAPVYPMELKRQGVTGMVTMAITVDEKGNVADPVVKKSTIPDFEKPAVEAITKWKFKPAMKDGKPVAVQVVIPLKFALN